MPETDPRQTVSLVQQVAQMGMGEKIRLALTGDREARGLLARENNKLILSYVIQNPRLTEQELLSLARERTLPEEVLVAITKKKEWLKRYPVRLALCQNPKTPLPVALRLLHAVRDADLRKIARSRDVSVHLASAARRLLASRGLL